MSRYIDLLHSDNKKYLIYTISNPLDAFAHLNSTKDLFLKAADKPIVVIDGSFEGSVLQQEEIKDIRPGHYITFSKIHTLLSEYRTDLIVLVYGDANLQQNYSRWCNDNNTAPVFQKFVYRPHTLLQRSIEEYNQASTKPNLSFKPKHFICLNAVPRIHRFEMVNLLYENNWQHKGHISWLKRHSGNEFAGDPTYPIQDHHHFNQESLKLDFDGEEINTGGSSGNQLLYPPQYSEACFDIVNETTVSDTALFVTDKTWKPILQKTPFIIHGSKNVHKHLEEYFGIKPYTDLFDYRFDILDYKERFASIKDDNLDILLNMDINELNEIVNSDKMQELLEYNKKQLLTHFIDKPKDIRLLGISETGISEDLLEDSIMKSLILLGY
jgi:hypothetical protein